MKINQLLKIVFIAVCLQLIGLQAKAKDIEVRNGNIILDFSTMISPQASAGKYTIKRATGKFSEYKTIGSTSSTTFVDKKPKGNPHDYYYQIMDSKGELVASISMDAELFGDYVYIYSDTDRKEDVGHEINAIHDQMFGKEFSPNRYALLFKAGDYKEAGLLKVPFYVHLAGLGKTPFDVEVSNIHTPPHLSNGNGTCTFWRSTENLSVIGPETYDEEETFKWAVSKAAPISRNY